MIVYRRPYVESSVFIAFIRGETRDGNHDCKRVFESILDAASQGRFLIYTSALTIAEVCKKKDYEELKRAQAVDLRAFFRDPNIRIVEVDREIGEQANEFCQSHLTKGHTPPKLRPNDAIHLACAERAGCDFLLTYDKQILGQTRDGLTIEWPTEQIQTKNLSAPGDDQSKLPFSEPPKMLQAPSETVEGEPTDKDK